MENLTPLTDESIGETLELIQEALDHPVLNPFSKLIAIDVFISRLKPLTQAETALIQQIAKESNDPT